MSRPRGFRLAGSMESFKPKWYRKRDSMGWDYHHIDIGDDRDTLGHLGPEDGTGHLTGRGHGGRLKVGEGGRTKRGTVLRDLGVEPLPLPEPVAEKASKAHLMAEAAHPRHRQPVDWTLWDRTRGRGKWTLDLVVGGSPGQRSSLVT
jgi:hypothetical protein